MNAVYLDTFSDGLDLVTLAQLEKDYAEFKRDGEFDDYETFPEYVNACLYHNNGALLPVADCVVRNDFSDSLRLSFADCVYILREHMHVGMATINAIRAYCGYEMRNITRPELIDIVNDYMVNH